MKRVICCMLALCLLVTVAACSGEFDSSDIGNTALGSEGSGTVESETASPTIMEELNRDSEESLAEKSETEGFKMKKHISTKVYSMLAVLFVIFLVNAGFLLIGTLNFRDAIQIFSDTYMQMLVQNEIVTRNVTESRLYGNLIVLTPDEQTASGVANGVPSIIETIDAAFSEMETLCSKLDNSELVQVLQEYEIQYETLRETILQIAGFYQAGYKESAAAMNSEMRDIVTIMQEKQTIFADTLNLEAETLVEQRIQASTSLCIISLVICVIFILLVVVMLLVISQTIVKPAKSAANQLNNIIGGIQDDNGDLTQRISVNTQDEVGQLVRGINNFIGQLQTIMKKIQIGAVNMEGYVESININIKDSEASAGDVSATMEQMSASMQEISATLEQITHDSQNLLGLAEDMRCSADGGTESVNAIKMKAQQLRANAIETVFLSVLWYCNGEVYHSISEFLLSVFLGGGCCSVAAAILSVILYGRS